MLDNPYIADLRRAAREYFPELELVVLRFGDLQVGIGNPAAVAAAPLFRLASPAAKINAPEEIVDLNSADVNSLIVRSMPIGSLEQVIFRMDCLQAWESRGIRVINPAKSLEIAIDKWLCLHRLSAAGVEVPPTICCQSRSAAMDAFEVLGGDVLVKPLFGGEGRGILRANDRDMAWRIFGTLQQLGQVLYVQQFIQHFGYDIRVLFVGDRIYAARRVAPAGHWRTNISQGSVAEPHVLTDQEFDAAQRARSAVGGSLLGIDLLPARDGRLFVLEVNAVPGWKGISTALGIDVAKQVLDLCQSVGSQIDSPT